MRKIKKLPNNLINLIAAGEVVERPASVVKELVENSIDAGSTHIQIETKDAGQTLIQVVDNGSGIELDDANLIFEQHATSKLLSEKELESILTMGFRGEALASIAEVSSKATIHSKSKSNTGVFVKYPENSQEKKKSEQGTVVRIEQLFEKVPARKKFLKTNSTENRHIAETFLQVALPQKSIHFELKQDGNETYTLPATQKFENRIFEVFGKTVSENTSENSGTYGVIKITGYLGNSATGKARNKNQFIFVNNRFIKSPLIHSALKQGYKGFIHRDLQPFYILFIEIPPHIVDINIHPRKLEAKFENESELFRAVLKFVKSSLENESRSDLLQSIREDNKDTARYEPLTQPKESAPRIASPTGSYGSKPSNHNRRPSIAESISFTKSLAPPDYEAKETGSLNEPEVRNLIQLFNTYITFEKDGALIFIDQHAAAEKIAFEKLVAQYKKEALSKPLLLPEIYEFETEAAKREFLEKVETFTKVGLSAQDFGGKSIQITDIPEVLDAKNISGMIEEIADPNRADFDTSQASLENYKLSEQIYILLATMACHGSIRAGQPLQQEEMKQIVNDLQKLENPGNCPHGRPVLWKLRKSDIEKGFNRDI